MRIQKKTMQLLLNVGLVLILCIYGAAILRINFSGDPSLYCTDMYSDMVLSREVWNQKTLFPGNWVFGNQIYVVATPALAALCYGITQSPVIAMGMASTLMALGVMLSFDWMIKCFFRGTCERLLAAVFFMTLMLLAGDPVFSTNGWQLLFTMCSYYACYAITVFLTFGCYLRSHEKHGPGFQLIFAAACALSFGTGIQSLRQTAVMVLPLVCVEFLKFLRATVTKRKYGYRSAWIAGIPAFCNLAGVVCSKFIVVQKNEIFGMTSLQISSDLLGEIVSSSRTPFYLFPAFRNIAMILFGVACVLAVIRIFRKKDWLEDSAFLCMLLCIASVVVIWGIDVFTTMHVREIYYFLLFPMAAVGVVWVYSKSKAVPQTVMILVAVCMALSCGQKLLPYFLPREENDPFRQVSNCLEEEGITTVYSHWNFGEKVAIASDFRIRAGFWDAGLDVFRPVKYLCDPAVFDADPAECAYFVRGEDVFERAQEVAQAQGVQLELLEYFPEVNAYVFTADAVLMR